MEDSPTVETRTTRGEIPGWKLGEAVPSLDDMSREYMAFFDAGFRGTAIENVEENAWNGHAISAQDKAQAWNAGKQSAAQSLEKGKKTAFTNYGQQGKVIYSQEALRLKKEDRKAYRELENLASGWGVNIQLGRFSDFENGSIQDGVIRINAAQFRGEGKKQTMLRILEHEITHRMQETAPEAYAKFRDFVLEAVAKEAPGHLEDVITEYQQKYSEHTQLSREDAMDEIVADYTQFFLEDTQLFGDFMGKSEEHRGVIRKFLDAVKAVVDKIRKTFSSKKAQDDAAREALGKPLEEVEQALKLWEEAYAEGQKVVKNTPVRKGTGDGQIRKSLDMYSTQKMYQGVNLAKDASVYTYEFLTSLPDMEAVKLPEVASVRTNGDVDKSKVVSEGIKNARSVGTELDEKVYVKNRYTGHDIRIDVSCIRHGLNGDMPRLLTNGRLGAVIGQVVQNAVPINSLYDTAEGVKGTYAMAQYAYDSMGREFVAIVTVEQRNGNISDIEVYDVAHALSGRQKRGSRVDTKSQGVDPSTATMKSIAEFLEIVKTTHQSILSESVLDYFGEVRNPNGYYAGKVKHSLSGAENVLRESSERIRAEKAVKERLQYLGQQVAVTKQTTADPKEIDRLAEKVIAQWGAELESSDIAGQL